MSRQPVFRAPAIAGQPVFQPQMPVFQQPQRRDPDPNVDLICDNCGDLIEPDEEAVEILHGVAGTSQKSGRPMVVEKATITPQPFARLHLICIPEYVAHFICDWAEDPPICAMCEEKITESD